MSDCWLYTLSCSQSTANVGPLYVGISDSPSLRMGNHESQKWWWWLVDHVEWERFSSREDAKEQESRAIDRLRPAFNYQESMLSSWDRMVKQVSLLWRHETNAWDCPACPFCESHGRRTVMSPSEKADLFRRNCDDELVIHWVVECLSHASPVSWANHCLVTDFLIGFGKCPRDDAERLVSEALRNGPVVWEDRLNREATLLEIFEHRAGLQPFALLTETEATDGR